MATVKVVFKEGYNNQEYSYKYDERTTNLKAGDVVVVDSPRNGYVTAEVKRIEGNNGAAVKWIVCKVDDHVYKIRKAEQQAVAIKQIELRKKIDALPIDLLEKLYAQYEDA